MSDYEIDPPVDSNETVEPQEAPVDSLESTVELGETIVNEVPVEKTTPPTESDI